MVNPLVLSRWCEPGKPVFNRTIGLRDSFAKAMAKG